MILFDRGLPPEQRTHSSWVVEHRAHHAGGGSNMANEAAMTSAMRRFSLHMGSAMKELSDARELDQARESTR